MKATLFAPLLLLIGSTDSFSLVAPKPSAHMQYDTGISYSLTSLSSSAPVIGSTWFLSSIILSTFSNRAFLKYEPKESNDFSQRQEALKGVPSIVVTTQEISPKESYLTSMLGQLSRPQLLTLYRFLGSSLMAIFLHTDIFGWRARLKDTLYYTHYFALPAIFLFIANHFNGIALDRLGISLTYTSKCIIPLATVLITVAFEGLSALPSGISLLTLIPIATGVALASWNTPTFEMVGFIAALTSSFSQAALNFTSKKVLKKTGVSGLQAQGAMATVASFLAIGMTLQTILRNIYRETPKTPKSLPPTWLSFTAIIAYHLEYVLSFLFLKLVQPISFGTCDAMRRLGIIVSGRAMFGGEPFSKTNYAGMILAIIGAMSYSIASNLTS